MTKNLDFDGLQSIADNYDLYYIDLWGVIHNGIKLHEKAIIVLKELSKRKKNFVLLTNAPRPNKTVRNFLQNMGMDQELRDNVFTSGEAALNYLKKKLKNLREAYRLDILCLLVERLNQEESHPQKTDHQH